MTPTPPLHSETMPMSTDFYDRYEVAELLDVRPGTVTTLLYRAKLYEAEHGRALPGSIPPPSGYIGNAPWWHREIIDAWLPERRGVGERGPARRVES